MLPQAPVYGAPPAGQPGGFGALAGMPAGNTAGAMGGPAAPFAQPSPSNAGFAPPGQGWSNAIQPNAGAPEAANAGNLGLGLLAGFFGPIPFVLVWLFAQGSQTKRGALFGLGAFFVFWTLVAIVLKLLF